MPVKSGNLVLAACASGHAQTAVNSIADRRNDFEEVMATLDVEETATGDRNAARPSQAKPTPGGCGRLTRVFHAV